MLSWDKAVVQCPIIAILWSLALRAVPVTRRGRQMIQSAVGIPHSVHLGYSTGVVVNDNNCKGCMATVINLKNRDNHHQNLGFH